MKKMILMVCLTMLFNVALAQKNKTPQIQASKKIKKGKVLRYQFLNDTPNSIYLFDPMQIIIEKDKNGNWIPLETPYCPCGRACPSPTPIKELIPNETITFTWNLEESLCENNEEKKRKVEKGTYRIVLYYGENQQERKQIVQKFKVR